MPITTAGSAQPTGRSIFDIHHDIATDSFQKAFDTASATPWITDIYMYSPRYLASFVRQPRPCASLAPYTDGVPLDAPYNRIVTRYNKMRRPGYAPEYETRNNRIDGDTVKVVLPELFDAIERTERGWARTLAGKNVRDLAMSGMRENILDEKDMIIAQGSVGAYDYKGGDAVLGWINGGTDLGNPTGGWQTDTGSNGILDYADADFRKLISAFDAASYTWQPIDVVLTSYINTLLLAYKLPYKDTNNLTMNQATLRGGRIQMTNNLQAPATVSTTVSGAGVGNTMVGCVRLDDMDAGWGVISSGMQVKFIQSGDFAYRYAMREIFSVEVVKSDTIQWMDRIVTA